MTASLGNLLHAPGAVLRLRTPFALVLSLCLPAGAESLQQGGEEVQAVAADTVQAVSGFEADQVTPGGAFLRSLLIPGWGHVATDSYGRGSFYVALQSGGFWMLGQSLYRRTDARAYARAEREAVRARLEWEGVVHPDSMLLAIEEDSGVPDRDSLVSARDQQVEDWIALSLFLVLLGAADAFVAAHLADYPEPLSLNVLPRRRGEGVDVGISIPFSGGFPRLLR
jgi:hypothetical protein